MATELVCLGWTLVLALVQIMAASSARAKTIPMSYNAGPRDTPPPGQPSVLAGRLARAQSNLFETLPLFAAAAIAVVVAGKAGPLSAWGATLYLAARVIYLPIYAAGVPRVRSVVWLASVAGLVMVIVALLR